MAEATALWELLRQAADPTVADALKTAVEPMPTGPSTASIRSLSPPSAGSTKRRRSARSSMLRGSASSTCPGTCFARDAAACSKPPWRSRASIAITTSAPSACRITSRPSTSWSKSLSPSIGESGASGRTIPARCPIPNTCGRSSGAPGPWSRRTSRARSRG